MPELMETLSSRATFFYKFLFTGLWFGVFALGSVTAIFFTKAGDEVVAWLFPVASVIGGAFVWWSCGTLKRVQLNGTVLIISNYFHSISVPVSDISEVRQREINMRPVLVTFKSDTPFGRSIAFIPPISFFSKNTTFQRLRSLVAEAASSAQQTAAADGGGGLRFHHGDHGGL
jgi:hypothetical protein